MDPARAPRALCRAGHPAPSRRELAVFDRDAARRLVHDIPISPNTPGYRLRLAVWDYLVTAADDAGQIRITATQIAEQLGEHRPRPPSRRAVHSATWWLRKHGLLAVIKTPSAGDQSNTYQLATTPPTPTPRTP